MFWSKRQSTPTCEFRKSNQKESSKHTVCVSAARSSDLCPFSQFKSSLAGVCHWCRSETRGTDSQDATLFTFSRAKRQEIKVILCAMSKKEKDLPMCRHIAFRGSSGDWSIRNGLLKMLLSSQPIFGVLIFDIQTPVNRGAVIKCGVCSLSGNDA